MRRSVQWFSLSHQPFFTDLREDLDMAAVAAVELLQLELEDKLVVSVAKLAFVVKFEAFVAFAGVEEQLVATVPARTNSALAPLAAAVGAFLKESVDSFVIIVTC